MRSGKNRFVCLIIFCYFIHYMVGSSIELGLADKKKSLKETLTADIEFRISLLYKLIAGAKDFTSTFGIFLSTLLVRFQAIVTAAVTSSTQTGTTPVSFYTLNEILFLIREQRIVEEGN